MTTTLSTSRGNSKSDTIKVKAVVTVKRIIGSINSDVTLDTVDLKDLLGRSLQLELVSAELDPSKYSRSQLSFFLVPRKVKNDV